MARRLALALAAAWAVGGAGTAQAVTTTPAQDRIVRGLDDAVVAATRLELPGPAALAVARGLPVVVVSRDASLPAVARAVPGALREVAPGVWELDRPLVVVHGATLSVEAPAVRELRLRSRPGTVASVVGQRGSLRFTGPLRVRSWNGRAADTELADGRASVSVRGAGRLDAADVTFSDLGFAEGRNSGVALTSPRRRVSLPAGTGAAALAAASDPPASDRPTGVLVRSTFTRNLFGAYTYEASGVRFSRDAFTDNVVYGLDPHDNSDGFVVTDNVATGNGRHGIIFSRFCDDNLIRGNRASGNGWHGIVLDDGDSRDGPSDRNRVIGNDVRGNRRVGISIDGSSDNVVTGNRIDGNAFGVRLIRRSLRNAVARNRVSGSGAFGVAIDGASETRLTENVIAGGPTGVRLRDARATTIARNTLTGLTAHGVKLDGADAGSVIRGNRITGAGASPILHARRALVSGNTVTWNYPLLHDAARAFSWIVGPGIWVLLLVGVVLGPFPFRLRRHLRGESRWGHRWEHVAEAFPPLRAVGERMRVEVQWSGGAPRPVPAGLREAAPPARTAAVPAPVLVAPAPVVAAPAPVVAAPVPDFAAPVPLALREDAGARARNAAAAARRAENRALIARFAELEEQLARVSSRA